MLAFTRRTETRSTRTMLSMSMYGPVERTLHDILSFATMDSWDFIQSATRDFAV